MKILYMNEKRKSNRISFGLPFFLVSLLVRCLAEDLLFLIDLTFSSLVPVVFQFSGPEQLLLLFSSLFCPQIEGMNDFIFSRNSKKIFHWFLFRRWLCCWRCFSVIDFLFLLIVSVGFRFRALFTWTWFLSMIDKTNNNFTKSFYL